MSRPTAADLAAAFLDRLAHLDVDGLVDLWSDDAVIEFPFAPAGFPALVEGKAAIHELEAPIVDSVREMSFHDVEVHASTDPDEVIVEYRGEVLLSNGRRYDNRYCVRFVSHDGKLTFAREYFNPVILAEAFDLG